LLVPAIKEMADNDSTKSDAECIDVLKFIFDGATDFYKEIAPNGWGHSEFVYFFHPTPQRKYEEYIRMRDNLNSLTKKKNVEEREIDPSEFKQDDLTGIAEWDEFQYLLGLCTYDIFSNNHEVIGADNKVFDIGSMRGAGRFIADFLNGQVQGTNSKEYDYIDFYMGTVWVSERGNLLPFYEYVFRKLKEYSCDWKYSFPRLFLVDPSEMVGSKDNQNMEDYKPEQAVQKELESSERQKETKKMRDELDKAYREEYDEAKYKPLEQLVQGYKNVYGVLPNGHPQKEIE
jgi:hypothetical protein